MKKRMILGSLAVALLFLSVIFSIETPYGRAFGDKVLMSLGLKAWSNGYMGFHYTLVYSLVMFIVGIKGTIKFLGDKYPNFVRKLPIILLILVIAYPIITSSAIRAIKYNSDELNSIYYFKREGEITCDYDSEDEFITLRGKFRLKNYSNNEHKFHIKYLSSEFQEKEVVAINEATDKPEIFYIMPKSTILVEPIFKVRNNKNGSGGFTSKQVDISIFNEKEEIRFIENGVWGITIGD
ncbi:hypothetical protein [Wukongibacter sp. M2B1]|uniref:hypothetical protein n=1 Tax=Wukongibacter sp. M2B1 TaxID=3088895 RepID=UPI003D799C77